MKTFTVEKETVKQASRYEVASDGSLISELPWDFEFCEPYTIGFLVQVFDDNDDNYYETKYYPVYHNEDKVLKQIKADFPPEEYQNNNW